MTGWEYPLLLSVVLLGFVLLSWLVLRRGGRGEYEALGRRLAELETSLQTTFTQANADMAARVEQVRGDLRADLADRLHRGFSSLRETMERQLRDGRGEQAQRLIESTRALEQRFSALEHRTSQHLETIRANVDAKLGAISEHVQAKLEKNILEGFAHFQKVQEHLKAAEEQLRNVGAVGHSINELNSLLKLPHLRGKFGEAELGRLLADFLPAGAFAEQVTIVPGSKETVDAVVKFPKFLLPIDSKFNREQVLPLFEASEPEGLKTAREQLAIMIKAQARSISEKYIHPEHGTTNMALLFLPSETLYFEVIRNGELCEALHKVNVFPVSPNTLAISLRAVAMSISQFEFAKGVEKTLEELGAAQRSFSHFQKRFEEVGRGLEKAQEAYNTATGHLNRYTNRVVRLTGELPPDAVEGEPVDSANPAP